MPETCDKRGKRQWVLVSKEIEALKNLGALGNENSEVKNIWVSAGRILSQVYKR
jgi:hypothetical protein